MGGPPVRSEWAGGWLFFFIFSLMTEQEAFQKLSAACASAEHCLYEMSEKMKRWQVAEDERERVLQRLVSERFVDEERYCRSFVADKMRYNGWGRLKIEQALAAKRIPRDISRGVLDEISDEEYADVLRPIIQSKRKSVKAASEYELNQKLIRFALGRGFSYEAIRKVVDENE